MSADVDAADDPDAPDTREVAWTLSVELERLARYVDHYPDPKPTYILGWAEADPKHRKAVERWLNAQDGDTENPTRCVGVGK